MQFIDVVTEFLTAKEAANLADWTLDFYRRNIDVFVVYLERQVARGRILPDDWYRPQTIEKFLAHERRRRLAPATVHARYRALRVLFNWIERRYSLASPMAQVAEPEVADKPPRQIELETVEAILEAIPAGDAATWTDQRDRLLLALFFWTGLRLAEMAALTVPDVDMRQRLLYVRSGKGGKARYVPIPPAIPVLMLEYLMNRPPWSGPDLFLSNDGSDGVRGGIAAGGIRTMIKRRCAQAGVEYRNPHAFRHGFAMYLLNAGGMEMGVLSKLLGHSSSKITQDIYADWVTESIRREYDTAIAQAAKSAAKPGERDSK